MTKTWYQYGILIYSDIGMVCELSEPHPKSSIITHEPLEYGSPDRIEALANGRLIIAAPDLAEALRAMLPEYGWTLEYDEGGDRARMCLYCHEWQFFGEGEIKHVDTCPVEKGKAMLARLGES